MTQYQRFAARWQDCQKCSLHKTRRQVVLARGVVPATILFVGEAPGVSEDTLGKPFCGPAGKLLDRIIESGTDNQISYALTNLVCCIPKDEDGRKSGEPPEAAIKACAPRLLEFYKLCRPRLVVAVGALAERYMLKLLQPPAWVPIIHPAAIRRMDVARQGLAIQRCVVALADAVEEF
jgi:DNA polymerase